MTIISDVEGKVREEIPERIDGSELSFEEESDYADIAIPCFTLGEDPTAIASELSDILAERLRGYDPVESVSSSRQYVNIDLDWDYVGQNVDRFLEQLDGDPDSGETIVIDYSSPNVAKPMHIGHLGTTIIGDSLKRIYTHLGYDVAGINYLGDWGTQFGKLGVAFEEWGDIETIREKKIDSLYELYVQFHERAEDDPSLEEEARKWFQELENRDEEKRETWSMFREISIEEFNDIYDILGVEFENISGESEFVYEGQKIVQEALEEGIATESEGAIIVELEEYGLTNMIIRKSDGTTNYATRDLAALRHRIDRYDPEKVLYVVGNEQRHRFKQLFKSAELLGICDPDRCEHVNYGLMSLEDGQMSSREGRIVRAEDLIQESIDRVKSIIESREGEVENEEEAATRVGISAIKFSWLSGSRETDSTFDWDQVLSFEGKSGPYLQYTHSRCMSLLENAESDLRVEPMSDPNEQEQKILDKLIRFDMTVSEAASKSKPSVIAGEAFDLANTFNSYYSEYQIVGSDEERKRLSIVSVTILVLRRYMDLLGIELTESM